MARLRPERRAFITHSRSHRECRQAHIAASPARAGLFDAELSLAVFSMGLNFPEKYWLANFPPNFTNFSEEVFLKKLQNRPKWENFSKKKKNEKNFHFFRENFPALRFLVFSGQGAATPRAMTYDYLDAADTPSSASKARRSVAGLGEMASLAGGGRWACEPGTETNGWPPAPPRPLTCSGGLVWAKAWASRTLVAAAGPRGRCRRAEGQARGPAPRPRRTPPRDS